LKKILTLAFLEFLALGVYWSIVPSTKYTGGLGGFSPTRLALIGVALVLSALMLFLLMKSPNFFTTFFENHARELIYPAWFLMIIVVIGMVAPAIFWNEYRVYFERLRPLLVILGTLPAQLLLPKLLIGIRRPDSSSQRFFAWSFAGLLALIGVMWVSGLGITPEPWFWNGAGMPLTTIQWLGILLGSSLLAWLVSLAKVRFSKHLWLLDVLLSLVLFFVTAWVWTSTPMLKHFFSPQPQPPYFQPYPYSDARVYDTEAWSFLTGNRITIDFKTASVEEIYIYYSKPFYVAFLALLHRLVNDDYVLMSFWNAVLMALAVPILFWIGKVFHSRFLGMVLALTILFRQQNAILMAQVIAGVNPLLLITEVFFMLIVILLCLAGFLWLRKGTRQFNTSLLLGGGWGALSLMRLNALGMLPVFLFTAFLSFKKGGKVFWKNILTLLLGWAMVFMPWLVVGRDINGIPLLLLSSSNLLMEFWRPSAKAIPLPELSLQPGEAPVKNNKPLPFVENFPGFVFNHTLQNGITSFLTLPDSINPDDQSLPNLVKRPYWSATDQWRGQFPWSQVPFLTANIILIAVGIAWSWKRWRWAGLFPLLFFWNYAITLGLSRVSGSRYIVPIDWIVFLYFGCGLAVILRWMWDGLVVLSADVSELPTQINKIKVRSRYGNALAVALVLLLALPVPLVYSGALKTIDACAEQAWADQNIQSNPGEKLWIGKILYPVLDKGKMTFYLVTCRQRFDLTVYGLTNVPYGKFAGVVLTKDTLQVQAISSWQDEALTPFWQK
jgi:hypothetical protein